eukprot:g1419.t1
MNDTKPWQRRNNPGSKILTPMFSNPVLSTYRKPETLKSKWLLYIQRNSRTILMSILILSTFFLFLKIGHNATGEGAYYIEYSIVFDAGSTGSRVHVYNFSVSSTGDRVLLNDDFQQLKPGLSAFAGDPEKGAQSLVPLLEAVEDSVPETQKKFTPCELRATAGLRLLPGTQAKDLLKSVTNLLLNSSYSVRSDSVSILDGDQEGAYAWLTVNYLLQKLNPKSQDTAITIDLGGGSVQESYAISTTDLDKDQTFGTVVHYGKNTQPVYVHSYLGFGLMAARALILNTTISKGSNPCIPKQYSSTYSYGGTKYKVYNDDVISAFRCKALIRKVLNTTAGCNAPADECTFNGVWGGPQIKSKNNQPIYLFSYFWDRAMDVGMIKNRDALTFTMKPDSFTLKSHELCSLQLTKLKERYSDVDDQNRPFLCMDLTYISVILMEGFKLDPYKDVTLTKQIRYRGNNIETSWTLGAAIDSLSKHSETAL